MTNAFIQQQTGRTDHFVYSTTTTAIRPRKAETDITKIATPNFRFSTTANSKKVSSGNCNRDRQSEMSPESGNSDISETVTDNINISTANLGFTTLQA